MNQSQKTILVTGGAGYIGAHACKALANNGYIPVTYDNLSLGHKEAVKWGPFEEGDILDAIRLQQVFNTYHPAAVIHLAGSGYVGESTKNPAKYYTNNVAGTLSLLNAMLAADIKKIVFSSTCATYGIPEKIPILESIIQKPINPYGQSKLFIEKILQDYDQAFGLKSVILRYFNAAGADPNGEIGEDHAPEMHLIPLIFDVVTGKQPLLKIFGDDYPTLDGTCIRDFLHVSDIARAHCSALQYMQKNPSSQTFNLGTGKGSSVKEVIQAVEKITGTTIPFQVETRRDGDPAILIAAPDKAKAHLGWEPELSQLETIVQHAWTWYINRFVHQPLHSTNTRCSGTQKTTRSP